MSSNRSHAKRNAGRVAAPCARSSKHPSGGQPGNANAFKHGLYSKRHRPSEKKALQQIPVTDLDAEIGLTRAYLQRYLETLAGSDSTDPASSRNRLLTVTFSVSQIAAMARLQARARLHLTGTREIEAWIENLP
jgi:hypothetical protein